MNIKLYLGDFQVGYSSFKFSGGEVQVKGQLIDPDNRTDWKFEWPGRCKLARIVAHIRSSDDLMELLLLTDAVRRYYTKRGCYNLPIDLELPYLPYARQDRVCVEGEAFSLKVFCDIINAQKYRSVKIWDCHSDVGLALLDNVVHKEQWEFLWDRQSHFYKSILVSPDAGAMKKAMKVAQKLKLPLVMAEKIRNPVNGEIVSTKVHIPFEHYQGKRYVIIDDICDGGRTFIELAKELQVYQPRQVDLYVTHGIFSKGFEVFKGTGPTPLINHIYVANSWVDDVPSFVTKLGA